MSADIANLYALANERDSDKRRELLSRVADLFYADERDAREERECNEFAELVARLLKDLGVADRAGFSQRVAEDVRTPRGVAMILARDEARVAEPVLESSPALTHGDLVEIALEQTMEHRLAISKRRDIPESVTDALLVYEELPVLESVTQNPTALISRSGFDLLSRHGIQAGSLRALLAHRRDVPAEIALAILPHLSPDEKRDLVQLAENGDNGLRELLEQAAPEMAQRRLDASRRRLQVKSLMTEVERGNMTAGKALAEIATEGRQLDVALALSLLSGLPEREAANAVISTRVEPLALLCKALDLSFELYARLDAMRAGSVRLPAPQRVSQEMVYATVDSRSAARALRFVKVRATVRPDPERIAG